MLKRKLYIGLGFLVIFLMACNFTAIKQTDVPVTPGSPTKTVDPTANPGDPTANPGDLKAKSTSPVSVQLNWQAVTGASGYRLEVRLGDHEYISVAELPGDQTAYEAFPVPEDSQLTYRLQAVTAVGQNIVGTIDVRTPQATPNPLTVQAKEYEAPTLVMPTIDPNNPNLDPSSLFPPGFDPDHPENFDPSTLIKPVSASAEIGMEGGEVVVTTPNGITYTLAIPANSLDDTTSISLTPIENIDGLPFTGGLVGAVRIEPEGLDFEIPATLTITRSDGSPVPNGMKNFSFAFEGEGQEFRLHPFAPPDAFSMNPGSSQTNVLFVRAALASEDGGISIPNSQTYGTVTGTLKEARQVVQNNAPTDSGANFQNALAYAQQEDEGLTPIPSKAQLGDALLVKTQNGVTWDDLTKSLHKLEEFQKSLGNDPAMKGQIDAIWDALLERLNKMLENNKDECFTRDDFNAHALVSQMVNAKRKSFGEQMAVRFKNKFGETILKEISNNTKNCVVNLEINSRVKADTPAVTFISEVNGTIKNLKFKYGRGKTYLTGKGQVSYLPIDVKPNGNTSAAWCDPWVPLNDITATVTIDRLEPIFYPRTSASEGGALKDFKLSFTPRDDTMPMFKGTCTAIWDGKKTVTTTTIPLRYGKGSIWGGTFTVAHMAEAQTGGIIGWQIFYQNAAETKRTNSPKIANNIIENPSFSPGYGTWSESSSFYLNFQK
jgi:hypothetical protein